MTSEDICAYLHARGADNGDQGGFKSRALFGLMNILKRPEFEHQVWHVSEVADTDIVTALIFTVIKGGDVDAFVDGLAAVQGSDFHQYPSEDRKWTRLAELEVFRQKLKAAEAA